MILLLLGAIIAVGPMRKSDTLLLLMTSTIYLTTNVYLTRRNERCVSDKENILE